MGQAYMPFELQMITYYIILAAVSTPYLNLTEKLRLTDDFQIGVSCHCYCISGSMNHILVYKREGHFGERETVLLFFTASAPRVHSY